MNNKLFKDLNISNKPSRNGFDVSSNVKFSAKAGELLPVAHFTCMVGDSLKMSVQHRTRTAQMISTPFTEIREYFDWFFVPYRLLWKMAPNVLAQDTQNPVIASSLTSNRQVSTQLPQIDVNEIFRSNADAIESGDEVRNISILRKLALVSSTSPNAFGFNRMWGAVKLLNMLGYCYVTNQQAEEFYLGTDTNFNAFFYRPYVSLMPILAYNKIYYDYFRNTAWEKNQPYNYNVDWISTDAIVTFSNVPYSDAYWTSDTMFDLRYSNYPKDVFYGMLPNSQFGDVAEAEGTAYTDVNHVPVWIGNQENAFVDRNGDIVDANGDWPELTQPTRLEIDAKFLANNLKTELSILELRKQKFLQRYREIVGSGAVDYQNIIKKVFGVDVPDDLADHSIYIGGYSSTIQIKNTTNTNLGNNEAPVIRSNGDVVSSTNRFEFTTNEFGIIMCIYHAQPVIDYSLNAYHFDVLRTEVDDFANPVFDRLGFQGLPYYVFNNDFGAEVNALSGGDYPDNPYIGYTSRYYDYKTSVDRVCGVFREFDTFKAWLSPVDTDYLQDYIYFESQGEGSNLLNFKINSSFFKVDPRILNSIFFKTVENGTIDEDQLYVSAHFEIHKVTNLDYLGLPM